MFSKIRRKLYLFFFEIIKPGFFLSELLIPLSLLSTYLILTSLLLPEGINKVFVTKSIKLVVPASFLLFIVYILILRIETTCKKSLRSSKKTFPLYCIALLLFPLTPIVQYIISNLEILSWFDAMAILVFFVLVLSFASLLIPYLLRKISSFDALVSLSLAFSFLLLTMPLLSKQFSWHDEGSLKIQLPLLAGLWLILWSLLRFNMKNYLIFFVATIFFSNTINQIYTQTMSSTPSKRSYEDNTLISLIDNREPQAKPNIYLLIYDAYVINETLLSYGIDNKAQEQYLLNHNFKIYPFTYSIGPDSLSAMSRVLNVSTEYYGSIRRGVSGDGVVHTLLKKIGYETYGLFFKDYFFRGIIPTYDVSYPNPSPSSVILIIAILEGKFRSDINLDPASRENFLLKKNIALTKYASNPKFVYAHSGLPGHSQNSGRCLPEEIDIYKDNLIKANHEMRTDIKIILDNDPDSIVIIAGDHGPYLTKNCFQTGARRAYSAYDISDISRQDIQDRFGTFLAIRWPSNNYNYYDDITVLQDLFVCIFSYIYEDPLILKSKVEPISIDNFAISGAKIVAGKIVGGIDDGEPLFLGDDAH